MSWWQDILAGKEPVIIAGAAGGFVRWVTLRERFLDGVASVAVGAVCALYLSPLAEPIVQSAFGTLSITAEQRSGFGGFVIGLGGVWLAGIIIDAVRSFRRKEG